MALGGVYNNPEGKGVVHDNLTGDNFISIGMDGSYKATIVDLELDPSQNCETSASGLLSVIYVPNKSIAPKIILGH